MSLFGLVLPFRVREIFIRFKTCNYTKTFATFKNSIQNTSLSLEFILKIPIYLYDVPSQRKSVVKLLLALCRTSYYSMQHCLTTAITWVMYNTFLFRKCSKTFRHFSNFTCRNGDDVCGFSVLRFPNGWTIPWWSCSVMFHVMLLVAWCHCEIITGVVPGSRRALVSSILIMNTIVFTIVRTVSEELKNPQHTAFPSTPCNTCTRCWRRTS